MRKASSATKDADSENDAWMNIVGRRIDGSQSPALAVR